jgi:phytoene dehydrogenase-like protein
MTTQRKKVIVIGAGIGGLTTAALLAHDGYDVTVLEGQTYPGGSASTFFHKGYRFDSGATVAGGFQSNGPHSIVGKMLNIQWQVHQHEPAWVVHLPDRDIALTQDTSDILTKFRTLRLSGQSSSTSQTSHGNWQHRIYRGHPQIWGNYGNS